MISMNKGTHFLGRPMYGQLVSLLDKAQILRISQENGEERYVKHFDAWQHLVVMLYAVVKHFDSLCEIVVSMLPEASKLGHLGINAMLRRSTLSDANLRRSECIFEAISESCTPLLSTWFPRTADGAVVQSGSNACKSSIRRTYLSSPISYSKASGGIRRPGKRRAASKFTPILCQRVCALRHSFHLGGQGGFLQAPPLQLPQRRYLGL